MREPPGLPSLKTNLVGVSDILNFFLLREGEGESEGRGGGIGFFFFNENPRRGGSPRGGGAGMVSAANWGIWLGGGGQNIFFGTEMSTKLK